MPNQKIRPRNIPTTATAADITSGNFTVLDTPDNLKKLDAETLLQVTAQNALAGNIAPEFDPTRTSENPYKAGESVTYNGENNIFKVDHYGPWKASDVVSFGSVCYLIDVLTNGIIPYNQRLNGGLGSDWSLLHSATTENIDDYVSVTAANVDYSGIRNNSFLDYLGANKIKQGDKFHVSFYARLHEGDTATIKMFIGDSGSPQNKDIELTTSWVVYDFELTFSSGEGDVLWLQFSTQSAQVLNFDIKGLRVYSNDSLFGSLSKLSSELNKLGVNFANEFKATRNYFKNQVVLKDNVLYQFIANHSASVWTASDVRIFSIEKWFEGVIGRGLRLNGNLDPSWTAFNNATISAVNDYVRVVTASQNYSGIRNNSWPSWYSDYGAKVGDKFLLSFWARNEASEETTIGLYVGDSTAPQNKQFVINGEWRLYTFEFEYVVNNITFGRLQFGNQKTATSVTFNIRDVELYPLDSLFAKDKLLEKQQQDVTPPHPLKGKKIAVIGDSISTIYGNNTPYWTVKAVDVGATIQSYVTWYDVRTKVDGGGSVSTNKTIGGVLLTDAMIGTLQSFVPLLEDIGKEIGVAYNYNSSDTTVWSQVLAQKTGAELIANASWSGSSMCDGQAGSYALSHAFSPYTICRCRVRDDLGNFVNPDVIFIYRGTNDMTHEQGGQGYSVLDDYDMMENGYPQTDVNGSGKYSFRRAYYMTIAAIREAYPKAMIYCCTLNVFKRIIYDRYPTRNGIYSLPQMNKVIRKIAAEMGCGLIDFERDGITFENCYSEGYITDSATTPTHPSSKGHEVMARRAIADTNFVN